MLTQVESYSESKPSLKSPFSLFETDHIVRMCYKNGKRTNKMLLMEFELARVCRLCVCVCLSVQENCVFLGALAFLAAASVLDGIGWGFSAHVENAKLPRARGTV